MNLTHLTDNELIQHVIKFDTDPVRVRLATIMERMPGCILDSLEVAGMDPDTCLFENTYDAGQYISHLENEIEYLQRELNEEQKERKKLEARDVVALLAEVNDYVKSLERGHKVLYEKLHEEQKEHKETAHKLKMWGALND